MGPLVHCVNEGSLGGIHVREDKDRRRGGGVGGDRSGVGVSCVL